MRTLIQTVLAWLRWMHIDVYAILQRHFMRRMWRRARPVRAPLLDDRICIAVEISSLCSESQVGRDFLDKLSRTSIPYEVFNISYPLSGQNPFSDEQVKRCLSLARPVITSRHVFAFLCGAYPLAGEFEFSVQPYWEFDSGVAPWHAGWFKGAKHIVVTSDFCKRYFESIVPHGVAVHKVRYPFTPSWKRVTSRENMRERFGIPVDDFVVFFHFNLWSCPPRKNPDGAIGAFMKAFPNESGVRLVLKVVSPVENCPEYLEVKEKIAPLGDRVTLVNERLSHQDVLDLIAASDVYMSLHRGEGFGIGMLEAMEVGTPVICTNYGGNTEFCKSDTSFLVDYKMVRNVSGERVYDQVKEWPEPNVDMAAEWLRLIWQNPDFGKERARAALAFVADYFSDYRFEEDMKRYLQALQDGKAEVDA